jgi:hypothetical protein
MNINVISVTSRRAIEAEIMTMKNALVRLPDYFEGSIQSIFCDSKAGDTFTISVEDWCDVTSLLEHLDIAFCHVNTGHNGIYVEGRSAMAGASWLGDFDDIEFGPANDNCPIHEVPNP